MSISSFQPGSRIVLCFALSALLVCPLPLGAAWNQPPAVAFSGQATVVRATVLGITTTVADTGPLPSSGGAQQATLLSVSVLGLVSADVAQATTIGQGDHSSSEASVADLSLSAGGNSVSVGFLFSSALAVCRAQGPAVSGSSQIANLVINGHAIAVSGQPNQTITLPNGQIVINEQHSSVSGPNGTITVNALHVVVNGLADVVISSAHADITCAGPPSCTGSDLIGGGGWVTGPSGAKANFGFAGGIKSGNFWGHLVYIDHGPNGPKVHGTGVTGYTVVNATTRRIDGTAEVNGQAGFTYTIIASWNGDAAGKNDFFSIQLSNGYSSGGNVQGGDIEIDKPCLP